MLRRSRPPKLALTVSERQKEDERMRDIEILLESLFLREEITVRLIVDCLYDVGSVNLVNQRVPSRPLNRLIKMIARQSKPVFRIFMVRWTKRNCPHMIANWLHSQVRFNTGDSIIAEVVNPQVETPYMK